MNYYNDNDPDSVAWLRELMAAGLISPGEIDERSILDVEPNDLKAYEQCHFFAGIGGWSLALRLAGWPDDRPVWTASLPCQPFSAAGQQKGGGDDRHLWPVFHRLLQERGPHLVFGEQVAKAVGYLWFDRVSADLEAAGYAVGSSVLGAHSLGAPHIRQRLYWVAKSEGAGGRPHGRAISGGAGEGVRGEETEGVEGRTVGGAGRAGDSGPDGGLADADEDRLGATGRDQRGSEGTRGAHGDDAQRRGGTGRLEISGLERAGRVLRGPGEGAGSSTGGASGEPRRSGGAGGLADTGHAEREGRGREAEGGQGGARDEPSPHGATGGVGHAERPERRPHEQRDELPPRRQQAAGGSGSAGEAGGLGESIEPGLEGHTGHEHDGDQPGRERAHEAGPVAAPGGAGFWDEYDLLPCLDGKARRVEPGSFPLAHGVPARVVRLRGYGNAIVPQVAAEFIKAVEAVIA